MQLSGSAPTIKHFCANNQEASRRFVDSIVSERALREVYLKGFEIAVKEGKERSVMTTYNPVNGIWTAGSYDLCTTILRSEWGFDGIVMTGWWAESNIEGEKSKKENKVYYYANKVTNDVIIDGSKFNNKKGKSEIFGISLNEIGLYDIELKMKSEQGALAQLPLSIYYDNALKETITIRGTEGKWGTETRELGFVFGVNHYIKLYFGANGLDIDRIVIRFKERRK